MKRRKQGMMDKRLIQRDGYVCGSHVGGCGKEACPNSETNIDHIFSQAFFRDTHALQPGQYDGLWNLQRMHKACNNEAKGGFLSGFPVFRCKCHWLQIRKRRGEYALEVSYRLDGGDVHRVVVVPFGRFDVGGGSISDPKGLLPSGGDHVVAGFIRAPADRGISVRSVTIDTGAAFAGGRQSFGFVGKAKRGRFRQGENGHMFPLLAPDEIAAFNQSEKSRVMRGGKLDDDENRLVAFNSEVVGLEMAYNE